MVCLPAPACRALLAQATALWPKRSRASDGICPSAAHTKANPTSDHELGNAVDLTHDPTNGCDAHRWARLLADRRDRRVKYIISDRKIWNPLVAARATYSALRSEGASRLRAAVSAAPGWRSYSGRNPHTSHAHVSIHARSRGDTSPWFVDLPTPPVPPAPSPIHLEEDDMPLIVWDPDNAWLIDAGRKTYIEDSAELSRLKAVGVKELVAPKLAARTPEAQ